MDKGEFIKGGYTVEPGEGGSWIVWQGGRAYRQDHISAFRGFSSFVDLTRWLTEEHVALAHPMVEAPAAAEVWVAEHLSERNTCLKPGQSY